ncbi:MAG: ARMT1-like domain-containing protein [Thermoprotei archaeon]
MKPSPECVRCILNTRFNEVLNAVKDPAKSLDLQIKLLEVSYRVFNEYNELSKIASEIYDWLVRNAPEIGDYYRIVKRKSIDNARKNYEILRKHVREYSGYEAFRKAVVISIAGNILDTGVYGHNPPSEVKVDEVFNTGLSIDHTREAYEILSSGGLNILWLFDNAGEAVYDLVLIELLREYGNKVIGVVKEDPGFQNDLTVSDAEYMGLEKYVDELVSTGYSGSSIHLYRVSSMFFEKYRKVGFIIAKGMAHYEYLSELNTGKPVLHLLIPKCDPIARSLGVPKYSYVALLKQPR